MKKKSLIILSTLILSTFLVACQTKGQNVTAGSDASQSSSSTTSASSSEIKENKATGIYEHFQTAKNELWYEVTSNDSALSKDDEVPYIFLVNKGEITIYRLPDDMTIGELSKMDDKDIRSKLKEWNKTARESLIKQLENQQKTAQNKYNAEISGNGSDDPDADSADELEGEVKYTEDELKKQKSYQENGEVVKPTAKVSTNSTGNSTDYEILEIGSSSFVFNGQVRNQIFASKYAGLCNYKQNSDEASVTDLSDILVNRDNLSIMMDDPSTKGVDVD